MRGKYGLYAKIEAVKPENCLISEITLAELKFGVENSANKVQNQRALEDFLSETKVVPIIDSLDFYAKEKARLRRTGFSIDDFDLLIGATCVVHNFIMVTNNIKHFNRITGILIEDWTFQ